MLLGEPEAMGILHDTNAVLVVVRCIVIGAVHGFENGDVDVPGAVVMRRGG
jgi:hypothetical protein